MDEPNKIENKENKQESKQSNQGDSNFVTMVEFDCVCGEKITTRPPHPRIMNYPETSVVIFTHERYVRCKCNSAYLPVVSINAKGEVKLIWKRIKTQPPKEQAQATAPGVM